MGNAVTASQTALPLSISTTNNAVLHLCWDNFDLNEETASGAGTTHSTHGIVIQELADPDITTRTEIEMPRTGARSVKPREVTISPCFSKPKVEPNVVAHDSQAEHDIKESSYLIFTWLCCRKVGSLHEFQPVPSFSGWLSLTAEDQTVNQSVVEYMPPLNVSINETSTVNHILETSLAASAEAGQAYTIVTFDLAVARKAYSLVWQFPDKFSNVIVRMGVFHTICSIFGTLGKLLRGSGFSEIVIEANICASGSLERVLSGKHYNRALRVHKIVMEALERLLLRMFEEREDKSLDVSLLESLTNEASDANLQGVLASDQFLEYFERYQAFKEDVRRGDLGKTARFWIQYIDILQQILMLIKATKENDLESHIGLLHDLCPLFVAFDHVNYARYTSVYLMTLENLENTHPGATELLKRNGFSVARSAGTKMQKPC